jgi:hypothetical protein
VARIVSMIGSERSLADGLVSRASERCASVAVCLYFRPSMTAPTNDYGCTICTQVVSKRFDPEHA